MTLPTRRPGLRRTGSGLLVAEREDQLGEAAEEGLVDVRLLVNAQAFRSSASSSTCRARATSLKPQASSHPEGRFRRVTWRPGESPARDSPDGSPGSPPNYPANCSPDCSPDYFPSDSQGSLRSSPENCLLRSSPRSSPSSSPDSLPSS